MTDYKAKLRERTYSNNSDTSGETKRKNPKAISIAIPASNQYSPVLRSPPKVPPTATTLLTDQKSPTQLVFEQNSKVVSPVFPENNSSSNQIDEQIQAHDNLKSTESALPEPDTVVNINIVDDINPTTSTSVSRQDIRHDNEVTEFRSKMANLNLDDKIKITKFVRGIPTFTGKRDSFLEESLNVFLTECKNALDMFSPEEQNYFMTIINSRFRGDALILINSQSLKTFAELQEFLYSYYLPRRDPLDVMREINMIHQNPGESILGFRERLEALVGLARSLTDQINPAKAVADHYKKEIVKQAIRAFKFGIRDPAIQTALFHEKTETIEEVAEAAQKWEKIENLKINPSYLTPTESSIQWEKDKPSSSSSKTDELLEKILLNLTLTAQPVTKQKTEKPITVNRSTEDSKCDFCNRVGHSIKECRTKQNTPFCNFCHQYYHTVSECPRNISYNKFSRPNMQQQHRNFGNHMQQTQFGMNQRRNQQSQFNQYPSYQNRNQQPSFNQKPSYQNRDQQPASNQYSSYQNRTRQPNFDNTQQQYNRYSGQQDNRPQQPYNQFTPKKSETFYNKQQPGVRFMENEDDYEYYPDSDQGNESRAVCSPQTDSPN